MARADRRRETRAKPVAATASRHQSAYVGTEDLFFQRLRKQAKWIFVALAFIFAFSFVVFGVGSDVQGGIADAIGARGGGGANVDDARERTVEHPQDPDAWRDLATALQQDGRSEEAIAPMQRYVALAPKDTQGLNTLASLYLIKAQNLSSQFQNAQTRAVIANPGETFALPPDSPFGQAFATNPITSAVSGRSSEEVNRLYSQVLQAYQQAKLQYAQLADLQPNDASIQLQLAQAAENANDPASAIAAYKQFLKLAPDDPSAAAVKSRLQLLQASSSASAG
jgi:tetratricopeptide (TPR) repeat protein